MMSMQKQLDAWKVQYEQAVKQQEDNVKQAQKQYQLTVEAAEAQMEALVKVEEEEVPINELPPTASFITSPDGEKMLVLNMPALESMQNTFQMMSDLVDELIKQ